ncbi:MAG TPA: hypothetical protein PJ982_16190 [Lacipirellulaceae bacterium]|nr:hypothetical protein [Lacipirellulaceae bacterium]
MARSRTKSKRRRTAAEEATLAHPLPPEDVRPGDHVAVLYEINECPSFLWCGDGGIEPRDQLVRLRCTPTAEPVPPKVLAVCLPFVLVKTPQGARQTLDVRRRRLARLGTRFARRAARAYRRACRVRREDAEGGD